MTRFAEACAAAGIDHELSSSIRQAVWEKFVFLVGLAGTTAAAATHKEDEQQIAAIIEQFGRGFAEMDVELLKGIWDRDYGNVIYVATEKAQPPRGWPEVERYIQSFAEHPLATAATTIGDVSPDVFGDVAYAFFAWRYEERAQDQDETLVLEGRNTLILHRKRGAWKAIHYHESRMNNFQGCARVT